MEKEHAYLMKVLIPRQQEKKRSRYTIVQFFPILRDRKTSFLYFHNVSFICNYLFSNEIVEDDKERPKEKTKIFMGSEATHIGLDPSHITSLEAIVRTLLTSARAFLLVFILTG